MQKHPFDSDDDLSFPTPPLEHEKRLKRIANEDVHQESRRRKKRGSRETSENKTSLSLECKRF
jgi:hypothetical protein